MNNRQWDSPAIAGTLLGAMVGGFVWFLLGFMGLPKFLIYLSGIWIIQPVLKLSGLQGEINLLIPALFVSVCTFALYGLILGAAIGRYSKVEPEDSHWK